MADGDPPLTDPIAATGAVRDFRRHLKTTPLLGPYGRPRCL
ncbi:hypothetical protein [Sinosporangium siamense]|nr:hypothetical protein [Sinosporangium siamense]